MFDDVQLITFDLDDTLWPCIPVIENAEKELYNWLKANASIVTEKYSIENLREHRNSITLAYPELAYNFTKIRLLSLQSLMKEFNLDLSLANSANLVFRKARNMVKPYDDVFHALHSLRKKYTIITLTNGNAQVEQTPLAGFFHYSLMAEDVGAAKPNPALFIEASNISGIDLEKAIHVGDDPLLDIHAAREAGMLTVWVNRKGSLWPKEIPEPNLQINDLENFTKFLNLS